MHTHIHAYQYIFFNPVDSFYSMYWKLYHSLEVTSHQFQEKQFLFF